MVTGKSEEETKGHRIILRKRKISTAMTIWIQCLTAGTEHSSLRELMVKKQLKDLGTCFHVLF